MRLESDFPGINTDNLGYFVLDNALNNNTTLIKLRKYMGFNLIKKRLRYIGYILNLIAKAYLFRCNRYLRRISRKISIILGSRL
jgi:hypothetical protein